MSSKKRTHDDSAAAPKAKKVKVVSEKAQAPQQPSTSLLTDEVDFPRGGGTTFTPLEVKQLRAEATKEAEAELFQEEQEANKTSKKKRKGDKKDAKASEGTQAKSKSRIELLNYKRINVGMKIFGQIVAILPLALVVSLPNQLFGHVPITGISSQFTALLERMDSEEFEPMDEDSDDEEAVKERNSIPELSDLFSVGKYVRAVVSAVHPPGATDVSGIGRTRDEVSRASKRVELSLLPEKVNGQIKKADLKPGFTLTTSIKSREDHGYVLDLGISDVSGFLSIKDAEEARRNTQRRLSVGELVDVTITKAMGNGRIFNVKMDYASFSSSCLTEVITVSSLLPGTLVQGLITDVEKMGIHIQLLGFFEGTVDIFHLDQGTDKYKTGKKVKARILYDYSVSPPKFALALSDHIVKLAPRRIHAGDAEEKRPLEEVYPIGSVLDSVKVLRIEPERGLVVEVAPKVEGFVHISHVSDDHVVSFSPSGPWKVNSIHPARVTGYFSFDGLLQLSMKPSILEQKFLQVTDVEVGQTVRATIKKLTDAGLFVSLSGGVDGVIWPNHYADIVLKHPAKRFKEGGTLKCKILSVDPEKKRISLTNKKTLVDSTLPIISQPQDAKVGMVTHAVVFRHHERHLLVEFYSNLKAVVPLKEISDPAVRDVAQSFPIGRVVRVRILNVEDGRIVASIKQASAAYDVPDISAIEIGQTVEGKVTEIHKENAVLALSPSKVTALISLKNIANYRKVPVAQLRTALKVGDELQDLVVVTRNTEKGFVIAASKPKPKEAALAKGSSITMETVSVGQLIGGRVVRHTPQSALVKITSTIGGVLHITDTADDFSQKDQPLPPTDSVIKAVVVDIDQAKRQFTLSTRPSRMRPDQEHTVTDRELRGIEDVEVGRQYRGYIKNINDHGLFVTIGRGLDARVQIRELFDDYVKEWKDRFKVLQLVSGRVLSADKETKKIEMTFRSDDPASRQASGRITLGDLKAGQKLDGIVSKVEDYGLFIQIDNTKLNGLCHKSELSDNSEADVSAALQGFRPSDRVKVYILGVDGRRISLSLKPSHFTEDDLKDDDEESDEDVDMADEEAADADETMDVDGGPDEASSEEHASDDESEEELDIQTVRAGTTNQPTKQHHASTEISSQPPPTLSLSAGFQWTDTKENEDDGEAASSDDEETERAPKNKRKRKEIEQDLTADMHTRTPQSNADFERLLLGSPNSSYLWIQYMSFQLPLSEVDKARDIARRALKTINFREEQEKLNVWVALLNLENVYGNDETVETTFKEAARANDSKTIHLKLAAIFDQSDKVEKAEEQFKKTCKKFGQSSKVWTLYGEFLLRKGSIEEARKLLPRSLQALEKRKHLKTISRFAQLEYKYGDPERGKTLFEGIVDSHPKRWDMWLVYMDMEGVQRDIQSLRHLFDRVLGMKMTSHKAKTFFKKWLDLEKRIGDEEGIEAVKKKAVEWTQKAALSAS